MNNTRRSLALVTVASLLALHGCGGGQDNYTSADLGSAYEAIGAGMSYAFVRSLIGTEANTTQADGRDITLYRWEADRGTFLFTTLVVRIHVTEGTLSKAVTGPSGSRSEVFDSEE